MNKIKIIFGHEGKDICVFATHSIYNKKESQIHIDDSYIDGKRKKLNAEQTKKVMQEIKKVIKHE
jgi:hypothetical protein